MTRILEKEEVLYKIKCDMSAKVKLSQRNLDIRARGRGSVLKSKVQFSIRKCKEVKVLLRGLFIWLIKNR